MYVNHAGRQKRCQNTHASTTMTAITDILGAIKMKYKLDNENLTMFKHILKLSMLKLLHSTACILK